MTSELGNKELFPRARDVVYLDTAAEGLPPSSTRAALERYFAAKSSGSPGRAQLYETERQTVALAASLLDAAAENVALVGNASDALNLFAGSLDWQAGDEIVLMDLEFPSNVLPWLRLRELGVRVRLVRSKRGAFSLADFEAVLNERTKLVTVSQVSYKNGFQIPFLDKLADATHNVGALFVVDATQALGRVPVSAARADLLVASSYKWTLGCHGVGVVYAAPGLFERFTPAAVGWYSVRDVFRPDRFEAYSPKTGAASLVAGMPNFPGIYALQAGLSHIRSVGVERIDRGLAPLMARLRGGLEERGFDLITPPGAPCGSGIVSFAHAAPEQLGAELAKRGVIVWAGDGRVRSSVHLYNDASDIEGYLEALDQISIAAPALSPSPASTGVRAST
ncbi:MAG: aminotransferase class V-fold PLP-dependent enzyme [Bryobacterales bacterium]|nr:aminotransferase class V-fold PLP-dependent enzyme [Bryobacterales bacterium]